MNEKDFKKIFDLCVYIICILALFLGFFVGSLIFKPLKVSALEIGDKVNFTGLTLYYGQNMVTTDNTVNIGQKIRGGDGSLFYNDIYINYRNIGLDKGTYSIYTNLIFETNNIPPAGSWSVNATDESNNCYLYDITDKSVIDTSDSTGQYRNLFVQAKVTCKNDTNLLAIKFNAGNTINSQVYVAAWSVMTYLEKISNEFDDSGIIANQDKNTQDIINNQDKNAQDIINNQDKNKQDIIDNQNKLNEETYYDCVDVYDNENLLKAFSSCSQCSYYDLQSYDDTFTLEIGREYTLAIEGYNLWAEGPQGSPPYYYFSNNYNMWDSGILKRESDSYFPTLINYDTANKYNYITFKAEYKYFKVTIYRKNYRYRFPNVMLYSGNDKKTDFTPFGSKGTLISHTCKNKLDGELKDKTPLDDKKIKDYQGAEDKLTDESNLSAIDNLDVSIDRKSSDFTWDVVTKCIQSHAKVFALVITMLSLGIVKLILNR